MAQIKEIEESLKFKSSNVKSLKVLIDEVLSCDPRPSFQKKSGRKLEYKMKLMDYDVVSFFDGESYSVEEIIVL